MRKWIRWAAVLLSVLLAAGTSTAALAADTLDLDAKGSIAVTLQDTGTKEAVSGGSFTLYRVASVQEEDGNLSFQWTQEFAACGLTPDNIQSSGLASALADWAEEQGVSGTAQAVSRQGLLYYDDLPLGLYLLVQTKAADGYQMAGPFLVSVPMTAEDGSYCYAVDATPKVSVEKTPDTPPVTPPDTPDTPPDTPTGRLPQTGQLWWPAPLLAASGLVCVAVGWVRRRSGGNG